MDMLGLKEIVDGLAKASGVRWYKHELRRDNCIILTVASNLEIGSKRKREQPKKTWKEHVEGKIEKIAFERDMVRWSAKNCRSNGVNPANSIIEDEAERKLKSFFTVV